MVEIPDVLIAVRRKLLANPKFSSLVGVDVGVDPAGGLFTDGWVFRGVDDDLNPEVNPRNTGKSAVVFDIRSEWTNPVMHNTLNFPLLSFRILSDVSRGSDPTLPLIQDASYRCYRVANAIEATFNDVANRDHVWPNGVYIVSSVTWNRLKVIDVPKEDGLVSGTMSFALELG